VRTSALVSVAVALNLALAGAAALLLVTGDEGEPRDATSLLGDLAVLALWALPAVVALAGRQRHLFLLAAGVLALLVVPTTFSLSLLMLVPAVLYVAAAATSGDRPRLAGAVTALAVVVLGAAAGVTVFALTEGRCWEYETRADGTTVSRTVPTEGRWESTNGGVGGSGGPHVIEAGSEVVEAGGGCKDRTTLAGAMLALVLVSASAGVGVLGPRLHSPA
jgi:hypothetical protein